MNRSDKQKTTTDKTMTIETDGMAEIGSQEDICYEIRNLKKWFRVRESGIVKRLFGSPRYLKAVDDISFNIKKGEILGVAGQSGCGKSTLGELLLHLQKPTAGDIRYMGDGIAEYGKQELKNFRKNCQVIFQDPYESLNPRFTINRIVREPLRVHNIGNRDERTEIVHDALEDAGLEPPGHYLDQLPEELSGGQRQRVSIARALVTNPDFILADEPVSMLDVSVRTDILHLFKSLQEEYDLTMLYISHDLSTINYITDRTMIMYLGDIVEIGPTNQVIHNSAHPYTEALVDSVPKTNIETEELAGDRKREPPDPINLPIGCRYEARCEYATQKCKNVEPGLEPVTSDADEIDEERHTSCHHPVNEGD